jgi:hypothetical protein
VVAGDVARRRQTMRNADVVVRWIARAALVAVVVVGGLNGGGAGSNEEAILQNRLPVVSCARPSD